MGCTLYSCHVSFKWSGFSEAAVECLKNIQPLPRFTHSFQQVETLEQLSQSAGMQLVVLFTTESGWQPSAVRRAAGKEAKCILCTTQPVQLSEEELERLDAVWPYPLQHAMLRFSFRQLQERLVLEQERWLSQTYLDRTIDTLPDLVWYKDLKGAHLKVNQAFCNLVGKTREDIEGRGHYYIWGLTKEQYEKGEFVCLETEEEVIRQRKTCLFEEEVMAPEGLRKLRTYKTPIFADDGTMLGTVGIARDVTKEYEYREKILAMARKDELTGLANRRYFHAYIKENRGAQMLTILYFDLDHFKSVNDRYGHQSGDAVIMMLAEALQKNFAKHFTARMGGDEFVVAILGEYDLAALQECLNAFIQRLGRFFARKESLKNLTLSAGVAFTRDPAVSVDVLLHQSDLALYRAKAQGRARFCMYDPMME